MKKRPIFVVFLVVCVLFFLYHVQFPQDANSQEQKLEKKLILQYTSIFGAWNKYTFEDCPLERKCEITFDKSLLPQAAAVVFHDSSPAYPSRASEDQKMVMYTMESAPHVAEQWKNVPTNYIDWVMSHLSLSDVNSPYGGYWVNPKMAKERGFPPSNLAADESSIFSNKTVKGALWFVSNCETPSKREKVFGELGKRFKIDIVGACSRNSSTKNLCPKGTDCDGIKSNYYFLIIAENSVCRDYLTEKYWNSYGLPLIPIVLRRKIYELKVPQKSFIAVDDFPDAQSMADYLTNLMENKTAYLEYFSWRKQGWARAPWNAEGYRVGMCDLCEKLWKTETTKKAPYKNVLEWYIEANNCETDEFATAWIRASRKKH